MRWTQLQKQLHKINSPELKLKIHCTGYPLSGSASVDRYWITLDREIIWDIPKDFPDERRKGTYNNVASKITTILKDYLATSRNELLRKKFTDDHWGLTDILLAADRRRGKRSMNALSKRTLQSPAEKVLKLRQS
jgi:hypothetical protein